MTTIYAIHAPEADRLAAVKAEMVARGAPTIAVVDCGDHYMALEGSHRLAAAAELGLAPILAVSDQDELIDISGYDWYANGTDHWAGTLYAAGEVAGELHGPHNVAYSFAP